MLNNLILFVLFILLFLVTSLLILTNLKNKYKTENNETFLIRNNPNFVDGQMNFNYLVDPNYTKSILNRYYINDDTKINGQRVIIHPNQYRRYFANDFYYGNTPYKQYSDSIYQTYGIRL